MALGQNITVKNIADLIADSSVYQNVGGRNYINVFLLGTSALINEWSRYKPIRDANVGANWPAGSNGKYGFNIPSSWDYLQPRGRSGGVDEPVRPNDFKGYEHDRDLTGPVLYCLASDIVIASSITPSLNDNVATGEWKHKANLAPHNNVKILPADLGLENYYTGLHLQIGVLNFYKTGAQVNAIGAGGQVIGFDARITNFDAKSFEDFPSGETGTYTWKLFISSSQHASWTTTTPTNYIELPGLTGETVGSKLIKSRGTFVMNPWLIAGNSNSGGSPVSQFIWAYNDTAVKSIYLFRAGSTPPGLNAIHDHFEIAAAYQGGDGGNLVTNDSDAWDDGTRVDIRPKTQNNGSEVNGDAVFGLEITHHTAWGNQVTIHLRHEGGSPPSAIWECYDYSLVRNTINSGLTAGSNSLNLTFGFDPNTPSGNIDVWVFRNGSQIGHTTFYKVTLNDVTDSISISTLNAGDIITITIGNL